MMNTKTRYRYLYHCPRGFANEYKVVRVSPADVDEAEELIEYSLGEPNMQSYWISRREADRLAVRFFDFVSSRRHDDAR